MKSPRLTAATLDVLDVFVCDAPNDQHGFTLAQRTHRPAGTIYPILIGLEEMGWLASRWDENTPGGRPRRRLYHLTEPGLAGAARQAHQAPSHPGCAAVRRRSGAGEVPLAAITACPPAGPRGDGDARAVELVRVSVEQQLPSGAITSVIHTAGDVVGRAVPPLGSQTDTGRVPRMAVLVPGLVTLLVMVCGITGSSYWRDETATVSATARPLPGLVRLLGRTDAVHGLYYLLMWVVARVAGTSEFAFRLPSAAGMALAAAGIAVIGWRLRSWRAGMLAGLVFAFIPVLSLWGQTARPYALEIAAAVFASYRLVRLPARPGPRPLAAYAASVALLGYLNLFGLLLVPAHAITIAATGRDTVGLRRWLIAAASGCAAVTPVAVAGWRERGQIAWIPAPSGATVQDLVTMLGAGTALSAVIIAALAGLGSVRADWPGRQRPGSRLTWLCLPWLLVPPLVLLTASQWMHVYGPAYVLYCAPPVALLAGAGLAAIWTPWRMTVLALVAGLTLPAQVAARQPDAHTDNIRAAATFLQQHARAGQGVIYWGGTTWGVPDWALAYPYGFTKLTDLGEQATPAQANDLFGRPVSPSVLQQRISRVTQIWVIELGHDNPPPPVITHSTFRLTGTWQISDIWLHLYTSQTLASTQEGTPSAGRSP